MRWAGLACLAMSGCATLGQSHSDSEFAQVPTSPSPPPVTQTAMRARPNCPPATEEMSLRLDAVGRKLLAANPQVLIKPQFSAVGSPEPEIFHTGLVMIWVTEGLICKCQSEAELAAALAMELGRMVSEREAVVARDARAADPPLPIALPVGSPGNALAADPTFFLEMAKYEQDHPRAKRNKPLPLPDPNVVARSMLANAGFQPSDLDAAMPLIRAAEQNGKIERQLKGVLVPGGTTWYPR
jgi:hypothetical protein